jgi:hypothetical protein
VRRRLLLAASAAATLLALTAPASWAVEPVRGSYSIDATVEAADICPFPVTVDIHVDATFTQYFDQAGNQTMWIEQDVERDVFSANGKTLTGLPFRLNSHFRNNPDGTFASYYATGGVERVPLPDGSVFWSAGRIDWLSSGTNFMITPTTGHSGNVAGFCAALAP